MRHSCTSCGIYYGDQDGAGKIVRGYCGGCWELHLATQRRNVRLAFVEHERQLGRQPWWDLREMEDTKTWSAAFAAQVEKSGE